MPQLEVDGMTAPTLMKVPTIETETLVETMVKIGNAVVTAGWKCITGDNVPQLAGIATHVD